MTAMKPDRKAQLQPALSRRIRRDLLAWYRAEARDLPWRRTKDPYAVWISEIMLQQTRIDQGTPYFERFMSAFPTVQALAAAADDEVLKLWEGLGYYTRARNLHRAARMVVEDRRGVFPDTAAEWQQLPGVGRYTAGAIASIAFGERAPVVDGNVIRVLTRLFDIADPADSSETRSRLWDLAGELVPSDAPGDFNQAMMELGARVCTPKRPDCGACPIREHCEGLRRGVQEERPVRRAKKAVPHHEYVVAVVKHNGRFLIAKRPPRGLLGGLWEFPGSRVGAKESHQRALERMMRDEFSVDVKTGGLIASVNHAYSHFRVTMNVYACVVVDGKPAPAVHAEMRWVPRAHLSRYAFPKANLKFLPLL
ncbi:MAG: A/G-specific adenine glycosylase [Candidatus Hydrogenedentes bacterium]|nr:A/G-specific adenine glycosylase [Candidatus Hydrogenedentota bacterium]